MPETLEYLCSGKIPDPRLKGSPDSMMSMFFLGVVSHGKVRADDDLDSVEWVPASRLGRVKMIDNHARMRAVLCERLAREPYNIK